MNLTEEDTLTPWQDLECQGLAHAQQSVLPLWEQTTVIRSYSSQIVPGILQTGEYTRAVLQGIAGRRDLSPDTADAEASRAARQDLLREAGRRFSLVLEESVLRTVIGGPGLMAAQLARILTLMSHPAVSLAIIPLAARRETFWPCEDFILFEDDQVNVELASGLLTCVSGQHADEYEKAFAHLSDLAVQGEQAAALITSTIRSFS